MRILVLFMLMLSLTAGMARAGEQRETAIVAGGCFWCVESDFDKVLGVTETVSGYAGGHVENPTYRQVAAKKTGHREVVRITFDPTQISYEALLAIFWRTIDPTDAGGQFCDRGEPYKTAIFPLNDAQRLAAERSRDEAARVLGKPLATPIKPAARFYPAEDYHQDYYAKNPLNYRFYRWSCGRDDRVRELWGEEAYRGVAAGHS